MTPGPPCPTPTKRSYPDEFTAIGEGLCLSRTYGVAFRPYGCQCGQWHITTWTLEQFERKRQQRSKQ